MMGGILSQSQPISGTPEPAAIDRHALLPRRSAWLFGLFRKYAHRYVRKHFHSLMIDRDGLLPVLPAGPLVVVLNHPSWWDPLIGQVLTEQMPASRIHYAPIDVQGLVQYPFLERLGFYGVEPGTSRGGLRFLRLSLELLAEPDSVLWVTAQGRFVDPRERPVRLRAGIGHLAHRLGWGTILPLALEYPFWNDRGPEALARFGRPLAVRDFPGSSAEGWTARLESALQETQDALAERARRRDPEHFLTLVGGTAGVGGAYDAWRRLKALFRGQPFRPEHRSLGNESQKMEYENSK
jgi:1-acyl-sn-glycerol-3-phosphate acyltransferase